ARSRAWPAATSTAAPRSKARCWVRRSSAGASPAAGPRMPPTAATASSASRTEAEAWRSLNHLVGLHQQACRHIQAQSLGRLHVDDQLEAGRLLHRNVG